MSQRTRGKTLLEAKVVLKTIIDVLEDNNISKSNAESDLNSVRNLEDSIPRSLAGIDFV